MRMPSLVGSRVLRVALATAVVATLGVVVSPANPFSPAEAAAHHCVNRTAVGGSIGVRWRAMGAEHGVLGCSTPMPERTGPRGAYRTFLGGAIFWERSFGTTQAVYGDIYRAYNNGGFISGYGWPISQDEIPTHNNRGRYMTFEGPNFDGDAAIFWTPTTGAHRIYGSIYRRWTAMGRERSCLGYPTSSEFAIPGGRRSNFENGYIVWDRASGRTYAQTHRRC